MPSISVNIKYWGSWLFLSKMIYHPCMTILDTVIVFQTNRGHRKVAQVFFFILGKELICFIIWHRHDILFMCFFLYLSHFKVRHGKIQLHFNITFCHWFLAISLINLFSYQRINWISTKSCSTVFPLLHQDSCLTTLYTIYCNRYAQVYW